MANLRSYGLFKHVRVESSSHLAVFRKGRLARFGRGLDAWFLAEDATSLAEIPANDRDLVLQISATTRDFQMVGLQGSATWRAVDPVRLAERIDFSIDRARGAWRADPIAEVEALVTGLVQTAIERYAGARTVGDLLDGGVGPLLAVIEAEIAASPRLVAIGVELAGIRLYALTPSPELVRSLRQPTVERLQQSADEATFARRAAAVEKEAAIAENETRAKIRLEEERAKLIARERDNHLATARAGQEAAEIVAEGAARSRRIGSEAEADAIVRLDEARLVGERERAEIARLTPAVVVIADALKQGFGQSKIGTLNLGPDVVALLAGALGRAASGAPIPSGAPASPR